MVTPRATHLVDAVQDLDAERELGTWQVRIQLLHGARPDDLPLYTCNPKDFAGIGERVVRPVAIA